MLLSDALRFAGRRADASGCYLSARRRFAGSPSAALAAFALGVMSAPAIEAGAWFETYLSEAPQGPLAAQALGRLLEGQHTAHDPRAAATAKRYLQAWPDGPHAALARLLDR
jgi:transmembrane sensor